MMLQGVEGSADVLQDGLAVVCELGEEAFGRGDQG
jgi:hypothetical protein